MQPANFKTKIKKHINVWESRLPNGIPDECHSDIERNKLYPSYKQICIAIMKNDYALKTLGYDSVKCLVYDELKKIELRDRGIIKQINLF
jgi:predicted phosphoadenosine phosphosulfate sulfurtransferase